MSEIDIIKYYCETVSKELQKIETYKIMMDKAEEREEKEGVSRWSFVDYNVPQGSKQRVKEELKAIRRLTLEMEKKIGGQ